MPAHACAPPLAAAAAGRCRSPVPVPGSGPGPGPGSLPGLILFESGLRVWVASIRSTTRTGPAPLRIQTARQQDRSASVGLPTDATAGSKGCNLSLGSDPLAPPRAL